MREGSEIKIEQNTYLIREQLGLGSYGKVYKGQNKLTQQIVAIKVQDSINEQELSMLNRMKGLKFKNLVNILNLEYLNRKYYIVMEYCQLCLFDQIKRKGTIKPDDVRFIMKEIGNGIKEIHDLGYAHRDLKPENVLVFQVTDKGKTQDLYKICDFGTIKNADVLQTQQVGTPYYLAPEQVGVSNNYSRKVDIWAFGALIYELLIGEPMFNGYSVVEISMKIKYITQKEIDFKIQNNLKLERKYSTLLLNMLQIDSNKRHDINQVISDLRGTSQTTKISDFSGREKQGVPSQSTNQQVFQRPPKDNASDNKQFYERMPNPNYFQQPINQQNQGKTNNLNQPPQNKPAEQQISNTNNLPSRGRAADSDQTKKIQFASPQQILQNPSSQNATRMTMHPASFTKPQAPTQATSQSIDNGIPKQINSIQKTSFQNQPATQTSNNPLIVNNPQNNQQNQINNSQLVTKASQNPQNDNFAQNNLQRYKSPQTIDQQQQNRDNIQQQSDPIQNQQGTRSSQNQYIGNFIQNNLQQQRSPQKFDYQLQNKNTTQQQQTFQNQPVQVSKPLPNQQSYFPQNKPQLSDQQNRDNIQLQSNPIQNQSDTSSSQNQYIGNFAQNNLQRQKSPPTIDQQQQNRDNIQQQSNPFQNQPGTCSSQNQQIPNFLLNSLQRQKSPPTIDQQQQNRDNIQQQSIPFQNQPVTSSSQNPQVNFTQNNLQRQKSPQPIDQLQQNRDNIQQQSIPFQNQPGTSSSQNPQVNFAQNNLQRQKSPQPIDQLQQQQKNSTQQQSENFLNQSDTRAFRNPQIGNFPQNNQQKQDSYNQQSQQQKQQKQQFQPQNGNQAQSNGGINVNQQQQNQNNQSQNSNCYQNHNNQPQAQKPSFPIQGSGNTQNFKQGNYISSSSGQKNQNISQQFGNSQSNQNQMRNFAIPNPNQLYQYKGPNK